MALAAAPAASTTTLAEILRQLGGIPAHRVAGYPPPGTATEDDLIRVHDRDLLCELVDGALVYKPMGFYESVLASELARILGNYVAAHRLGIVAGADAMIRFAPGLVRLPDVSFISGSRLPGGRAPRVSIAGIAPDLAIAVISEGNTGAEMDRKLREYFEAGVQLVWYVYPADRLARVYTSPADFIVISDADALDGGDVIPGFTLPLRNLLDAV